MLRRRNWWATLLLLVFVLSGCVTQKKKDDKSALGKLYSNVTSKYNGYFNANEIYKATSYSLEQGHRDNYNQLLPLYIELTNENPQAITPDMDLAIEKLTRVVAVNPQSQWADDSYLLVAKAQFYKQDYESAEKTLRYLVNNFDPVDIAKREAASKASRDKKKTSKKKKKKKKKQSAKKKRRKYLREKKKRKKGKGKAAQNKKEDLAETKKAELEAAKKAERQFEEPDNYGLKHRPAFQEGQLLLARTLIERDNYDAALRFMNNLSQNPKIYDDIVPQASQALAYYYIYRKDLASAIAPLEAAISSYKGQKGKARIAFILAQIYERTGNGAKAFETYQQVLKYGPDYEMEFNCRLNMTLNSWKAGKGSGNEAIANLERLARDEKNLEYRDQIYYAMAEIAMELGDKQEALAYFKESLRYSTSNRIQKAESYLAVADIYYNDEDYVLAKNYYDSTATTMNKTDERYPRVDALSRNLTDIAKNIQIIEQQDSFLQLGNLSDEALKEFAFDKFKKEQEAKRAAATQAANPIAATPTRPSIQNIRIGNNREESSFFAYDDRSVKRGQRDFQRKWGIRNLEDNWRRRSALTNTSIAESGEGEVVIEEIPDVSAADALTEDQLKELLKDIPRTESDRTKAELAIMDAMFELGTLYRDRLNNYKKTTEVLEELNNRFPRNNYELESWYYLYLAYSDLNDTPKANSYRRKILDKYASSKYARVLTDPEYAAKLADEEYQLNVYYDNAYQAFQEGKYTDAKRMADDAKIKFGVANKLQARFDLLNALTTGKLQGEDAYKNALSQVITKHPETDESRTAREILRIIGGASARLPGGQNGTTPGDRNFKLNDNQVHFVIIAFNGDVNLNERKVNLSDYNKKYHRPQRLTISNVFLGNDPNTRRPLLIVRRFKNRAEAMKYYEGAEKNETDFVQGDVDYDIFPISLNNYREILRAKTLIGYDAFFENNYLND